MGEETNIVKSSGQAIIWYTDGSKSGHETDVGVKESEPQDIISLGLGKAPIILQIELLAMTCTQTVMAKKLMNKMIIYTDNQPLRALKQTLDCTNVLK